LPFAGWSVGDLEREPPTAKKKTRKAPMPDEAASLGWPIEKIADPVQVLLPAYQGRDRKHSG
jgi:hypothetical protein